MEQGSEEVTAARARLDRSAVLEYHAVQLIKTYGWGLPAPAKSFFRQLAEFLEWQTLTKALK